MSINNIWKKKGIKEFLQVWERPPLYRKGKESGSFYKFEKDHRSKVGTSSTISLLYRVSNLKEVVSNGIN